MCTSVTDKPTRLYQNYFLTVIVIYWRYYFIFNVYIYGRDETFFQTLSHYEVYTAVTYILKIGSTAIC